MKRNAFMFLALVFFSNHTKPGYIQTVVRSSGQRDQPEGNTTPGNQAKRDICFFRPGLPGLSAALVANLQPGEESGNRKRLGTPATFTLLLRWS